jgi:signal transduction histidine kinase
MKLAIKLSLFFVLISLISIFILGYLSYDNSKAAIENEVQKHLTATNMLKESEIERWLNDNKNMLELLAKNTYFVDELQNEMTAHDSTDAEHMKIHSSIINEILMPGIISGGFFEFFIIRPGDGLVLISTDEKQEGKYQSDKPFFINGKVRTFIQNVYYSMTIQQPAMTVGTPIKDRQGNLVAVLAGRLNLSDLSVIMEKSSGLSQSEDTYLVNNFNFFITEPRFGMNYSLRKAVYTEGVNKALKHNDGVGFYNNYKGTPVIGAYHWLPLRELCLITEVSQSEAFTPVYELQRQIIFIGIGVVILSSVLGWLLSLTITKPLSRLVEGTRKISEGDFDHEFNIPGKGEISILSNAFDRMIKKLRETLVSRDKLSEEVSERKKVEYELKRSNAELENFAYVASHDLQEPLRMVASYTALLEKRYKDRLDSDANDFINYAVDGAKRMQQLINDLLAYSRIRTRIKPFEPVDLESVLRDSITNLRISINERKAKITHDNLPIVMGEEGKLVQVFQNLVGNAIKFTMGKPPIIHIGVTRDKNDWVFSVRDNGIGIESQYFDKIFLLFQRLQGAEYKGTGIGLTIIKRIVESHEGKIWVESEPGKGSIFYFTLPVKPAGNKEVND